MGVPGSEGGDDFLDGGNDEDGDDFIEAEGEEVPPAPPPTASSSTSSASPATAPKRRVRIKPMPASLVARWPKVTTMLITMNDGTQLLLVKGG